MSKITFKTGNDTTHGVMPGFGRVTARTAKRRVDGNILVMKTTVTGQLGVAPLVLELADTSPGHAWIITVTDNHGDHVSGYYKVSGDAYFTELTPIDPETLEPSARPDPEWWGELDEQVNNATLQTNGTLVFTRKNGQTINVGNVRGERGLQGIQGIQGEQGERGLQGVQGERGEHGERGLRGIQGIRGLKGDKGDQGLKGDKGDQGIQGIQGEQGERGLQGIQGIQGEQGERGLQGIQGQPGEPTAFELRGTGSPLGVVAAPPGTYYTDTLGTTGAWRWLKTTGTGTSGWIVIHGNTGIRQYTNDFLLSGFTQYVNNSSYRPRVVRIGDTVHWSGAVGSIMAGASGGGVICEVPQGFRPIAQNGTQGILNGFTASSHHVLGIFVESGLLKLANTTRALVEPLSTGARLIFSYQAETVWPTTYPAIPV